MASPKTRLTAVERARRRKIEALIREGREQATELHLRWYINTARLLDDLADVAENYLEEMKERNNII